MGGLSDSSRAGRCNLQVRFLVFDEVDRMMELGSILGLTLWEAVGTF